MNNRKLSWTRKYNNNHFIIASRAYFQQLYPTHDCIRCWLILMHVHDCCRSLVGRFSIDLLAFACTKRECCLYIQILKPKLFEMSPPYLPICGITLPFQVNLHVPPLNIQMNIYFVCLYRSWSDMGRSISSKLSGLFSWGVFIHLSLHERGW